MLSRNCDGCSQQKPCSIRFQKVKKGEKVYCSDGTAHLVDEETATQNIEFRVQHQELLC